MPNNPLTQAELSAYTSTFPYPQIPAGYFFASPPTGAGPLAYRLFDASYISIGIINPNRLGTGSTGAGNLYLADDGTWKLVSSISLPTPTLQQVTTAGNTTTNAILAAQFQINGTTRNARLSSDNVGGFDINYNIGGTPDWRWFGGGTTALTTFKANGNVLIGTTTDAGYKLDVAGNTRVNGGNTSSDVPFLINNRFQFRGDGVLQYGNAAGHGRLTWDNSGAYFQGQSGYGLGLGANGVLNHLFINTSGNIGIGTTSPQGQLHIVGTGTEANPTILRVSGVDANTSGDAKIIIGQNSGVADLQLFMAGTDTRTDGLVPNDQYILAGQRLSLMNRGNGSAYNTAITLGDSTTNAYANIAFKTALQNSAAVTRMLIDGTGNVGIGTTSPTSKLHIAGGRVEIDNGFNLESRTSTGNALVGLIGMSTNSINVGIWEGNYMNDLFLKGGNGSVYADFSQGNSKFFAVRGVASSTPTEYMRVTSTGNVLIGTTTDSGHKLNVVGSVRSTIGFQSSVDESTDADNVFLNGFKYGYINNAATNKPVTGNSHYANLGTIVLTHFDSAANNDFYIRSKSYNGNTAWNKIWTALNDGAGSGLDADLLDGQNSSEFLRVLSLGVEASLDTYTDIGVRTINFTGSSQHLLSWNLGGSPGTVQQLFNYNTPANGWRIRNKTDNTTWSSWGYVVMASANQGLISGTVYHSGNLTNLNQLTNGPGYITSSANITGNAATATTLQNARTLTIGATGKTFNGSANVSWTLGEIQAEYQVPINTLRNNLGDPTVREAALFHGQFNNKFRFISPTLQEESADGITWTTSTRATATQLGDMMRGEGEGTSFAAIPTGTIGTYGGYRLTWAVVGITSYVFLNALYVYNSTNGNNVTIRIEAYHNTNGWQTITGPHTTNNWPGHAYIPHTTLGYSNNAAQYSQVRITFETTRNAYTNAFTIYSIEWVGGYPQGKRNAESYDRLKNVTFPADISSPGNIRSNNGTVNNILSWTSEPAGVIGTTSNHPLAFWTNNTERMRITATGNVGIGTTSPISALQVSTPITASSNVARGTYLNQTLVAAANNDVLVGLDIAPTFTNGAFTGVSNIALRVNGNIIPGAHNTHSIGGANLDFAAVWTGVVRATGSLELRSGSNVTLASGGTNGIVMYSATRNVVLQNGGTFTDAGYRLDVNGTARIQSSLTVDTDTLFVDASNNRVGIGTTTPGDKLSIVDGANANIFGRITANGTNASAAWVAQNDQTDNVVYRVFGSAVTGSQMGISLARSASLMANLNGTGSFLIGTYSGTDLVLGTANNENMRISNNTGNVLINTNIDAGYLLDVNGSARISGELTLGTDNISDAWVAYTPIWSSQGGTQPNLGDGTLTGFYKKIGKTVFVRVKLNFGLTTIGGDGAWLFSLPVNAASQDGIQFPCSMLDNGFAWYQGIVNGTYSGFTDKSAIIAQSPGGANSSQGVSGAFPFGWGNGDSLQFNGSYECI